MKEHDYHIMHFKVLLDHNLHRQEDGNALSMALSYEITLWPCGIVHLMSGRHEFTPQAVTLEWILFVLFRVFIFIFYYFFLIYFFFQLRGQLRQKQIDERKTHLALLK